MVPMINLESDLASNPKLPTAGVLSGKYPSLATIQNSCQANKVQQCEENLDQIFKSGGTCDHDFTLKDNDKESWTKVPSKTFSPAKLQQLDCTNPPCKEQTINCEDKVSRKIVCSNTFDALMTNSDQELHVLSSPILQVSNPETTLNKENPMITPQSKRNDKSLVKETNPSMAVTIDNSKKILTINTKVLEISHEPEAEVSRRSPTATYDSDLGSEMFDEDDEDDMLDILFDKVAKDGDLSPRQQRSGSNKNKKKTYERQHSWDGKVTGEFIPRHLPMRLAKQNHITVSTTKRSKKK
ncbi:hypothetical protein H5410_011765 [Solanum commersonii]|uniref:NB-ARC domain containing protein n=1 Tax=Solanum commersonii TaxID=4109 RepID=A0A9J6AQL6_SOLCO|nr:hypothetical protein H5410_011765 [Solanum commersonii]